MAPTRVFGWGTGNAQPTVATITQASGVISFSAQTKLGDTLTIAQLLALATPVAGQVAYVVDTVGSAAPTWHATIAGGGATAVEGYAFYNNTATAWQWM